jgi:hypothetical protein
MRLPAPDHEKQRSDDNQAHQDADLDDFHLRSPPTRYYATIAGWFSFLFVDG